MSGRAYTSSRTYPFGSSNRRSCASGPLVETRTSKPDTRNARLTPADGRYCIRPLPVLRSNERKRNTGETWIVASRHAAEQPKSCHKLFHRSGIETGAATIWSKASIVASEVRSLEWPHESAAVFGALIRSNHAGCHTSERAGRRLAGRGG